MRPAEAVPVWEAGHPLTHTDAMKDRLRGAMHELMGQPGLVGAPDSVRMTAVALAAKISAADLSVEMTARELGRWVGVTASTIGHEVRPYLDREHITDSENQMRPGTQVITGIRWQLLPLLDARHHQPAHNPLRLEKVEFAVLWGLLGAVCAPGWSHRDGRQTPPGLLGTRTGRSAATDRLALLLLVLESRATGVVRLCGGAVDEHGRLAATIARLLGSSPTEGAQVLARLVAAGVVEARVTPGGREQLVIPAVEAAYREMRRIRRAEGRPGGLIPRPGRGATTAGGDQIPAQAAKPQVNRGRSASEAGVSSAGLHAYHAPMADLGDEGAGSGGFSGYSRGGTGNLPGRACTREDQTAETNTAAGPVPPTGAADRPLRGEMQTTPPTIPTQQERQEQATDGGSPGPGQGAAARLLVDMGGSHHSRLRGRVPRPRHELQVALAPVEALWDRLDRSHARDLVEEATYRELWRVASWVGDDRAEAYLADRLTRRLTDQKGRASGVKDPVGWLLHRGLPSRSHCGDQRCDEGTLMHSGAVCERCEEMVADRRRLRRRIADEVRTRRPEATPEQLREAIAQQVREAVNEELAQVEERRRQAEAAEVQFQADRKAARKAAEAAEQVRRAMPCIECGKPEAAGLCQVCRDYRESEKLLLQAVTAVAAGSCDDPDLTAALVSHAEAEARTRIQAACSQTEAAGGNDIMIALAAKLKANDIVNEYRADALNTLARGLLASAEADQAHAAQMRRRHLYPDLDTAQLAAAEAADQARTRTAEHLLATRSKAWRVAHTPAQPMEPTLQGRSDAYQAGAAQARATVTPARRPQGAWTCTDCGLTLIGQPPAGCRCAACEGKAAGLSRAERFARLAGAVS